MGFFNGHGLINGHDIQLCIDGDPVSPVEWLPGDASTQSQGDFLTLVINACHSAYVDFHYQKSSVSVISSSPASVSVNSRFAEAVSMAIKDPMLDSNCDGIVTDQELFAVLRANLQALEFEEKVVPRIDRRAYPHLRRHARGQVPLPIASRCSTRVRPPRPTAGDLSPELYEKLAEQEAFALGKAQEFPHLDWDYFLVIGRPDVPASVQTEVVEAILADERKGTVRLFSGSVEEATAIAKYAAFTEFYRVELLLPYIRIVRLRDERLIYSGRPEQPASITRRFPYRVHDVELPDEDGIERIVRDSALMAKAVSRDDHWVPTPCETTLVGECFTKKVTLSRPAPIGEGERQAGGERP